MVSESVQQSGCNQIKPTSKEKRITNHGRSAKSTCWEDWPIDQLWTLFFCFLFHLFLSWVLFRKSHNNHSWKPFKSFLPLKSNCLLYGRSRLPRKARSNALTSIEREMWRLSLFTHPFLKREIEMPSPSNSNSPVTLTVVIFLIKISRCHRRPTPSHPYP